jgi:hypothetical protein
MAAFCSLEDTLRAHAWCTPAQRWPAADMAVLCAIKARSGGLAFMLSGRMFCRVFMLRLGSDGAGGALDRPHVRPVDSASPATSWTIRYSLRLA